jgi:hypothetical protein
MNRKLILSDEVENNIINDKRIKMRLSKTIDIMFQYPNHSIPQSCNSSAEIKGIYRLFDNKKVTPAGILSGHIEATKKRMTEYNTVLLVQDTTDFNYSRSSAIKGMGEHSSFPDSKGLLLHSTLAVTPEGVPLGLLTQKYWTRAPEERGKKSKRRVLPIEEKESYRWIEAMEESTAGIPENVTTVIVADREADIFNFFKRSKELGQNILVRAIGNRKVDSEKYTLIKTVESAESAGIIKVLIPRDANSKTPEREVELEIKFCTLQLTPPGYLKNSSNLHSINLDVLYAKEINQLHGEKSIEWLLLSSLPILTIKDAAERLNWYRQRWKIERFHFTLKSGCKVEDLQLETIERIENAISLYSIVSWKILWLVYESRIKPEKSCEVVLEKYEWHALYCIVKKTKDFPDKPPTLQEASMMIARLGGFMCRKGDGDPGVKVMWRGLQRLNDVSSVWSILTHTEDVGND